jgi:hypothetical protein
VEWEPKPLTNLTGYVPKDILDSHLIGCLGVFLFKQNPTSAANIFHVKRPGNTNAFTNERNTHS